ncbi:MAG TPA: zf-TFIIB domain-containing protein [Thermomicrobiales bacterium]
MNCPACNVPLSMSDRQGVEIDYCPRCRGVWLDRGEIDKIVEREVAAYGPLTRRDVAPGTHEPPFYRDDRPVEREGYRYDPYPRDRDDYRRDRDRDDDRRDDDDDRRGDYRGGDYRKKKKKRESFLEDLFDF